MYVVGPAIVNMKLFLLWEHIQTSSKIVYLDAMEARVRYKPQLPSNFENIAPQYKYWYQYVIVELQVEVVTVEFPQAQE